MLSDPNRLSPISAVGELIIEGGPAVSPGYLNNPESSGFIDPPEWRTVFRNGKSGRLYRTGDLVPYIGDEGLIDSFCWLTGSSSEVAWLSDRTSRR